ncbi:LysR substrate-binding domain-containing protein [Cupriavidus basilensis]
MLAQTATQITFLRPDPLVLALSADSPLAARTSIDLSELGQTPFIVYSESRVPAMHAMTMSAPSTRPASARRIAQQSSSGADACWRWWKAGLASPWCPPRRQVTPATGRA